MEIDLDEEIHEIFDLATLGFFMLQVTDVLCEGLEALGRRWWVRPLNTRREEKGFYTNLIKELRFEDDEMFFGFTRMSISTFDKLLSLVGPSLIKYSLRKSISPSERLYVTL